LIVDPDAELASPIASQGFQPIPRRHCELAEIADPVQLIKFPSRNRPQHFGTLPPGGPRSPAIEDGLRASIPE
jgi:hypothetical protein